MILNKDSNPLYIEGLESILQKNCTTYFKLFLILIAEVQPLTL